MSSSTRRFVSPSVDPKYVPECLPIAEDEFFDTTLEFVWRLSNARTNREAKLIELLTEPVTRERFQAHVKGSATSA